MNSLEDAFVNIGLDEDKFLGVSNSNQNSGIQIQREMPESLKKGIIIIIISNIIPYRSLL